MDVGVGGQTTQLRMINLPGIITLGEYLTG